MGELVHHGVVIGPDDPDRDEADRVRGVARPDAKELLAERVAAHREVEDQERRGKGEDPVRERLQPVLGHGVN